MGFSIYDLFPIKEADGDENGAPNTPTNNDYSIDASMNNNNNQDIDPNQDPTNDGAPAPDQGGDDQGLDLANNMDAGAANAAPAPEANIEDEDEPVEANTDVFSSLTKEEQQAKIMELKKLYSSMYSSCDDLLEKINDVDICNDNIVDINRITDTLYNLKTYISDYLTNTFATKSYVENDIMFNRFLDIINTITVVIDKINKSNERNKENEGPDNNSNI